MESEQSNENEDELLVTAAASAVVTIAASTVIQKRRRRVGLAAVAAASSSRQACSAIPKTASAGVGSNNHGKHLVGNRRVSPHMRVLLVGRNAEGRSYFMKCFKLICIIVSVQAPP